MDSIELLPAAGAIDLANRQPHPGQPAPLLPQEPAMQQGHEMLALFESLTRTLGMPEAQAPANPGELVPIAEFFGQMLDMLHDDGEGASPVNG